MWLPGKAPVTDTGCTLALPKNIYRGLRPIYSISGFTNLWPYSLDKITQVEITSIQNEHEIKSTTYVQHVNVYASAYAIGLFRVQTYTVEC